MVVVVVAVAVVVVEAVVVVDIVFAIDGQGMCWFGWIPLIVGQLQANVPSTIEFPIQKWQVCFGL